MVAISSLVTGGSARDMDASFTRGHGSGEVPRIASPMPCYPPIAWPGTGLRVPDTDTEAPGPALIHIRHRNLELCPGSVDGHETAAGSGGADPGGGVGSGLELNRGHGSRAGAGGGR